MGLEGRWQQCPARCNVPRCSQTPSRGSKGINKIAGGRKEGKVLEMRCTRDEDSLLGQICAGGSLPGQGPALHPATKGYGAPSKRHKKTTNHSYPCTLRSSFGERRLQNPKIGGYALGTALPLCFCPALFIHTDKPRDRGRALCPSVGGCSPWCCLQGKALQAPVFFGGCPQLQEHSATSLPPLVAFELHGARETLAGAGAG